MQRSEGRLIETFGPVEGRRTLRRYGTAIHCRGVKVGVVLLAAEVDGVGGTMPSWSEVRSFALAAADRGFDSVWMFDHVFNRPDDGAAEGMYESWTILSALASLTERITLGALVMCSTFRDPCLLAKMAATSTR